MAGNIIPAIATTNAMTASLCVLQAFKVMRGQLDKAKFAFLTRSTERVIASESLQKPNPQCATCGVAYATLVVDPKRAKLSDLVDDILKTQLGYGEDFSIKRDADLLYDIDEDIHLDKTFEELDLKADTFITVFDEADTDAKVDVIFSVTEKAVGEDEKALNLPEELVIAKKPAKPAHAPETNGNGHPVPNGEIDATIHNGTLNGAVKRKASVADLEDDITRKKGKVMESSSATEVVVIEDEGAIVLD
jgi:ubiquitin-like 1-activating enzyme E1 B